MKFGVLSENFNFPFFGMVITSHWILFDQYIYGAIYCFPEKNSTEP
jgi:hypothetical protein